MSKTFLMVLGVLVALMGFWGLGVYLDWLPVVSGVVDPWWHSVFKILLGLAAVYVSYTDK
jgi:uncharacterized membrane protein YuzA (DUF378 family)